MPVSGYGVQGAVSALQAYRPGSYRHTQQSAGLLGFGLDGQPPTAVATHRSNTEL